MTILALQTTDSAPLPEVHRDRLLPLRSNEREWRRGGKWSVGWSVDCRSFQRLQVMSCKFQGKIGQSGLELADRNPLCPERSEKVKRTRNRPIGAVAPQKVIVHVTIR